MSKFHQGNHSFQTSHLLKTLYHRFQRCYFRAITRIILSVTDRCKIVVAFARHYSNIVAVKIIVANLKSHQFFCVLGGE